jgi:hypothetical protein
MVFTSTPPEIPKRVERCAQQEYINIQSAIVEISFKCADTVRTFPSPSFFVWVINGNLSYL